MESFETTAHLRSKPFVIDPAYSATTLTPCPLPDEQWLYAAGEYDPFILEQMRRITQEAKLLVGYPGCFHTPHSTVYYRKEVTAESLLVSIHGTPVACLNKQPLEITRQTTGDWRIDCTEAGILELEIVNDDLPYSIPALASGHDDWLASIDGETFTPAERGASPTGEPLPEIKLTAQQLDSGLYDVGREVLARVEIHAPKKPAFGVGESTFEAENTDPDAEEQSLDLVEIRPGVWQTPTHLAFRYLKITNPAPDAVFVHAVYTPAIYRGAFAADAELSDIWMKSAYTLRLCMHHFLIDGVKRDRLPWVGDLVISLMANAYTFGDAQIVRRTLVALGRAGVREQHLNGIVDYTLWFLIAHDFYQRYFGDLLFLEQQYDSLLDVLAVLEEQSAETGYLPEGSWLFIDWVDCQKITALQILYFWALSAAERLAARMQDEEQATALHERAQTLRARILRDAYDEQTGLFCSVPGEPASGATRYPLVFAILSGLADDAMKTTAGEHLAEETLPEVGTPYQAALEIMALHTAGYTAQGIERIRTIWGGMLRHDATTFHESYEGEPLRYDFYNRPYGKSLCHAWSAGPAALLPLLLFGVEPVGDAWSTYRCAPSNLCTPEMAISVPVPGGQISVEYTQNEWRIETSGEASMQRV